MRSCLHRIDYEHIYTSIYTHMYMYILIPLRFVKLRHVTLYTRNSNENRFLITVQINSKISFNIQIKNYVFE